MAAPLPLLDCRELVEALECCAALGLGAGAEHGGGAAAAVSPFLACIGSPCIRHCVHGASIGGGGIQQRGWGDTDAGVGACRELLPR
jgi:hypothetical protein